VYNKGLLGGGTGVLSMLPVTGFSVIWFVIAGFTLLMAGGALLRIAPRRHA
jgi:LPXTG-motif cell wall-anchored protein